jgi:peptide/nickel transport system ATP-binding protein
MTSTASAAVLSIRQLSVALPAGADRAHAVHQVSLEILPGQTLCVVGESGSGKSVMATTVMGLLAKELKPVGGDIVLQGESLLGASATHWRQ